MPHDIEQRALAVQGTKALASVNCEAIRDAIQPLLSSINRPPSFSQYTSHDISHVNGMLDVLNWMIPKETKSRMSPADWLMLTLSVYFHDFGMYISETEFSSRKRAEIDAFGDQELFCGARGADYKDAVKHLSPEEREKFIYQEFVRKHHASRVGKWIVGKAPPAFPATKPIADAISDVLSHLPTKFRNDLSLICESHHRDDLENLEKYSINSAYGPTSDENVNLQYIAILLRSADLLHITADRAPSVAFRVIDPSNPISQIEWSKHNGITQVAPKLAELDEDTQLRKPIDTIDVHAFYTEPEPFFALNSFINYAEEELRSCFKWARLAELKGSKYSFPWKNINRSNISAAGFENQKFSFQIDQEKILKLLTGHTLYNDSGVVARELIQNSIDATRLMSVIRTDNAEPVDNSAIYVSWDSDNHTLTVRDHGTGMDQAIIENNLLTVGASRYSEPQIREKYPSFSPISRFGIGVLSCFMVANHVDIYTRYFKEDIIRHISMRDLLGQYLIRTLDPADNELKSVGEHGTSFVLRFRHDARQVDIEAALRYWVVCPSVPVYFSKNGSAVERIGFDSTQDFVEAIVSRDESTTGIDNDAVKIRTSRKGSIELSFATRFSKYFKDWPITFYRERNRRTAEDRFRPCFMIEGIRIENGSPGFSGDGPLAVCNATGVGSPQTNVARSGLETGPEFLDALSGLYRGFCDHIKDELDRLEETFSATWTAQEGQYLVRALDVPYPRNQSLLDEAISEVPLHLIDEKVGDRFVRVRKSKQQIDLIEKIWVTKGYLFLSVESLLREAPGNTSMRSVLDVMGGQDIEIPAGPILCNDRSFLSEASQFRETSPLYNREITQIKLDQTHRWVGLEWSRKKTDEDCWKVYGVSAEDKDAIERRARRDPRDKLLWVPLKKVPSSGWANDTIIRLDKTIILPFGHNMTVFIVEKSDELTGFERSCFIYSALQIIENQYTGADLMDEMKRLFGSSISDQTYSFIGELAKYYEHTEEFMPAAWRRGGEDGFGM